MDRRRFLAWGLGVALIGVAFPLQAQSVRRAGIEFKVLRAVQVPAGRAVAIVVVDFFHHGEMAADGSNVLAFSKSKPLPTKVLQVGPGDYCRVAFQAVGGAGSYELLYGGEKLKADVVPSWTSQHGLLLETRQYKQCNLHSLDSVRSAFQSATPIGADYVESIRQNGNPFTLDERPFLSRYSGVLQIANPGVFGFLTSSQDASFLLIDDKPVVSAPGMHGPAHVARPGSRGDVTLSAGPHKFEYYHAASGGTAVMAAAWEVNPREPKPQPVAIPPEVFAVPAVVRGDAGPPSGPGDHGLPDFRVELAGFVPLPDNPVPLVGTRCFDRSPRGLSGGAKIAWDFGDGQTSDVSNPAHVYLRPGLYTVRLSVRRGTGKPLEAASRVEIAQPRLTDPSKLPKLEDYLPDLQTYNTRTLPTNLLVQWVEAFLAKADACLAAEEKPAATEAKAEPESEVKPAGKIGAKPRGKSSPKAAARPGVRPTINVAPHSPQPESVRVELARKCFQIAVDGGKVAFLEDTAAAGNDGLLQLARLIAPIARDRLGNSSLSGSIWQGASKRITSPEARAECLIEAADILVNDLINAPAAKPFLDPADKTLGSAKSGVVSARLQRVWGDYYALTGDGASARKAYAKAESLLGAGKSHIERAAWQGAHGRSTEEYLKNGDLERAASQLRLWLDEFPNDKVNGYLTLLTARYWAAREKYPQAIALAGQLAAVNADSPYADAIQLLAAECHQAGGDKEKAAATLRNLIKNYPGSPLLPETKQLLQRIEGGKPGR